MTRQSDIYQNDNSQALSFFLRRYREDTQYRSLMVDNFKIYRSYIITQFEC